MIGIEVCQSSPYLLNSFRKRFISSTTTTIGKQLQCDQMGILLFNLEPSTTMTICPVAQKCQSWYLQKFAKYKISHPKNCPKTFKILPKWRNFAKSGHSIANNDNLMINDKWSRATSKKTHRNATAKNARANVTQDDYFSLCQNKRNFFSRSVKISVTRLGN